MSEMKWGVDSDHPAIVNGINNMITKGFGKEAIVQIIGCPPEVVDKHMIRGGVSGAPKGHEEEKHREYVAKKREEHKKKTREWTDEQRQAARDRMAKVREAKAQKNA